MAYKTREAIVDNIAAAHRLDMQFSITVIPVDYPRPNFISFDRVRTQALFNYAADCAAHSLAWTTPAQSVRRNQIPRRLNVSGEPACPAAPLTPSHGSIAPSGSSWRALADKLTAALRVIH